MTYKIIFSGEVELEISGFFGGADDVPKDAGIDECAKSVTDYINDHGIGQFIEEWNLEDKLTVGVQTLNPVTKIAWP